MRSSRSSTDADFRLTVGFVGSIILISLGLVAIVVLLLPLLSQPAGLIVLFLVFAAAVTTVAWLIVRRRMDEGLRDREAYLRSILDSIPAGMHMYRLEPGGRLVFTGANPAADVILGVKHQQFIGKPIEEAFPSLVETEIPAVYRRLAEYGGVWHTNQFIYRHGTIQGVYEVSAFQIAPGNMATTFLDVTARAQAVEALARSEEKFRLLVEHSPAAVFLADDSFRFTYANEETARISERPAQTMIGLDFRELLTAENRETVSQNYRRRQRGEPIPRRYELDIVTPSGRTKRVEMVISVVTDSNGKVYSVGQALDLTERQLAEKERVEMAVEKERLDLIRAFISNITHDLKTPLTIIQTSLYLIERHTDPEKRQEKIEMIRTQAILLNRLIQDLLTISRLDYLPELNRDTIDLNELVQQVEEQLRLPVEKKRQNVQVQLDPAMPPINADREALSRAVTNLLENAVNYTPEEHSISLRTGQHDNFAVVIVADTGIGIEPEVLPFIFNRFYRSPQARETTTSGSGLGLAIVHRVAEMHGGRVEVESMVGQGSTFRLFLPLQPETSPASSA